jgi:hypothetical protein
MKPNLVVKRSYNLNPSEMLALIRDIQRGLVDVEAGRVIAHEEARDRLLARYK